MRILTIERLRFVVKVVGIDVPCESTDKNPKAQCIFQPQQFLPKNSKHNEVSHQLKTSDIN